ncbi:MAG: PTS sugar transporter subunit IIA [Phycisphaerae bacterium]|nr:PTS sugar transporter subunit IIA [Phycisphaerae bacterium]
MESPDLMGLTDILTPQRVKIPLRGGSKADIIAELIDMLAANGDVDDPGAVRQAVLQREQTASTNIGHGLALPHAKTDQTSRSLLAFGRTVEPVNFGNGTECPVTLVVLLLAPPSEAATQIQLLARLSRLMSVETVRRRLNQAASADEVIDLIAHAERAAA